jgi:hypothetical protein
MDPEMMMAGDPLVGYGGEAPPEEPMGTNALLGQELFGVLDEHDQMLLAEAENAENPVFDEDMALAAEYGIPMDSMNPDVGGGLGMAPAGPEAAPEMFPEFGGGAQPQRTREDAMLDMAEQLALKQQAAGRAGQSDMYQFGPREQQGRPPQGPGGY